MTPVVLIFFNKTETTQLVFDAIKGYKPKVLFLISDAPRPTHSEDIVHCEQTQAIVSDDKIDWDCQVHRLQAESNLGCDERIRTGLEAVFAVVDKAIILEDDCLPSPSFFTFCDAMLAKYADNQSVMMVSGSNYAGQWHQERQSYHFSYYGGICGWATWKRAWEMLDTSFSNWPQPETKANIKKLFSHSGHIWHRGRAFDRYFRAPETATWDFQWSYTRLSRGGKCIVPAKNLISNIGFGLETASHTKKHQKSHPYANLARFELPPPYVAPYNEEVDYNYDDYYYDKLYSLPNLLKRKFVELVIHLGLDK